MGLKSVPLLSPIFLQIESDFNKDPHSWMESLVSIRCEIQEEARWKRAVWHSHTAFRAGVLTEAASRTPVCQPLATPRPQTAVLQETPKDRPTETWVQIPWHWKAPGGASAGVTAEPSAPRALLWQLLQTLSPSATAPSAPTSISCGPKATQPSQPVTEGNNYYWHQAPNF